MSAMGNKVLEIQEALTEGCDFDTVAKQLSVPVSWVRDAYADMLNDYDCDYEGEY